MIEKFCFILIAIFLTFSPFRPIFGDEITTVASSDYVDSVNYGSSSDYGENGDIPPMGSVDTLSGASEDSISPSSTSSPPSSDSETVRPVSPMNSEENPLTESSTIDSDSDESVYGSSDGDSDQVTNVDGGNEEEEEEIGIPRHVPTFNHTIQFLSRLAKMVDQAILTIVGEAAPRVKDFGFKFRISEDCVMSMVKVWKGFKKQKAWTYQLIDSYGRPSAGFLDGTVTSLGDYDECLRVEFPKFYGDETATVGKYCILRLNFPVPRKPARIRYHEPLVNLNGTNLHETVWSHLAKHINSVYTVKGFRFGVCLPSTCSVEELEPIIRRFAEPALQMPIELGPEEDCSVRDEWPEMTTSSMSTFIVSAILFTMLVIGTAVYNESRSNDRETQDDDNIFRSKIALIRGFFDCFSVQANSKPLIMMSSQYAGHQQEQQNLVISAVHGIVAITILALIIGHTCFFGAFYQSSSFLNRWTVDIPINSSRLTSQLFFNSHLLIEILFFISGFLLVTSVFPKLGQPKLGLHYLRYMGEKWLRYSAITIGVTLFYFILPFTGSGPMFKSEVYREVINCEANWWPNLIGIGNWCGPMEGMCAPQLWLFSVDLQLHLLVPIILITYHWNEKIGFVVNVLFILTGIVASCLAALVNNSAPTIGLDHLLDHEYLENQFNYAHFPTYLHVAPFSFGILIGYLITKYQANSGKFKMSIFTEISLWLLTLFVSLFLMFYSYVWNDLSTDNQPSAVTRIMFAGLQRTLWCTFLAWTLFALSFGRCDQLKRCLSGPYSTLLYKLCPSIYAIHYLFIVLRRYSFKYTIPWDDHYLLAWSVLNIVLSIAAGYIIYITFEAPSIRICKLIGRMCSQARQVDLRINEDTLKKRRPKKSELPPR
ncbi:uncharacterized protein LOC141855493 [Brevipalpus obovatus]|uniref:uncharacterized protein LOC141855493 n=1 Tax=Brevipalpus obovatus TaxID=246614 RepID=UPI003D9FA94F